MNEFRCKHGFYGDGCLKCQGIEPLSDNAVLDTGWRDCLKELPTPKCEVLVWGRYECYDKKNYFFISAMAIDSTWRDEDGDFITVIAWMPLPDPPAFV